MLSLACDTLKELLKIRFTWNSPVYIVGKTVFKKIIYLAHACVCLLNPRYSSATYLTLCPSIANTNALYLLSTCKELTPCHLQCIFSYLLFVLICEYSLVSVVLNYSLVIGYGAAALTPFTCGKD